MSGRSPAAGSGQPGRRHRRRPAATRGASADPQAPRDQMLLELGIALRECLRKADIPARMGEGTFAVALPQTGEGALGVSERIAHLLSEIAGCRVTSGIASYPSDGREPATLIEIARGRAEAGWAAESGAAPALALPRICVAQP